MNLSIKRYLTIWQIFFENITLSLYSQKFYQDVYEKFKGFGLKHFLLCCAIASVINTAWFFCYFKQLTNYFKYNTPITYSISQGIIDNQSLDAIFEQLPDIKYDGKNISMPSIEEQAFFIKSPHSANINLVTINLDGSAKTKKYSLITLLKDAILINPESSDYAEKILYTSISKQPAMLNGAKIKSFIGDQVVSFSNNILYKIFPIMMSINVYYSFMQNLLLIVIATLFVKFKLKKNAKDGFRVVMFAIAPLILLRAVVKIFIPNVGFVEYYGILLAFLASRAIVMSHNKRAR
jgi:hypothetical protein